MKKSLFLMVLSFFIAWPHAAHAQSVQTAPKQTAATPGNAAQSVLATSVRPKKSDSDLLRKQVTFTGFMLDVARTNSLSRLLSLRRPIDPNQDGKNLVSDPVSGQVIGLRLLSVNF